MYLRVKTVLLTFAVLSLKMRKLIGILLCSIVLSRLRDPQTKAFVGTLEEQLSETASLDVAAPRRNLGGTTQQCLYKCKFRGKLCEGLNKKQTMLCAAESKNLVTMCEAKCVAANKDCASDKSQCVYKCNFLTGRDKDQEHAACVHSCKLGLQCCLLNQNFDVMEPPFWATAKYCESNCSVELDFCEEQCDGLSEISSSGDVNALCRKQCSEQNKICESTCEDLQKGYCKDKFDTCEANNESNCAARALCCSSGFDGPPTTTTTTTSTTTANKSSTTTTTTTAKTTTTTLVTTTTTNETSTTTAKELELISQ